MKFLIKINSKIEDIKKENTFKFFFNIFKEKLENINSFQFKITFNEKD